MSLFLENLGEGFATTVSGLRVDADKYGIRTLMTLLQRCCKLKRVGRYYAVVVIGSGDEGGRISSARLQVVSLAQFQPMVNLW